MPTYLDQLQFLFHGVSVDGTTSYVLGSDDPPTCVNLDDEGDEEDDVDPRSPISPMSTGSLKRPSSTADTASSPSKKHKSPMVKCMKAMVDTLQVGNNKDLDVAKQIQDHIATKNVEQQLAVKAAKEAELERCLELVKERGYIEESEEFYVATMKFAEAYNQAVFLKITTITGRQAWLNRCTRDWCG